MRWSLFAWMCLLLASGCTTSVCTTADIWNYDVVFTYQADVTKPPLAIDDLLVSTCFMPEGSAITMCAEQVKPGVLEPLQGTLDPAQAVISATSSPSTHQVVVRWRWQTPVWLRDGDRYRVNIATVTGETLYSGELTVSYHNITRIDDDESEFNLTCETQTVASANLQ